MSRTPNSCGHNCFACLYPDCKAPLKDMQLADYLESDKIERWAWKCRGMRAPALSRRENLLRQKLRARERRSEKQRRG